ncbi:unnamed protein product [Rotaria sordida]|uniref:Ubiquitin-like protease family profile domain-containing protein n=2 Tax=Rotaria sordida TaxID=392033 RepID=A0A814TSI0_9BILA|nr:unnamed protein product [Rotaria sordida]
MVESTSPSRDLKKRHRSTSKEREYRHSSHKQSKSSDYDNVQNCDPQFIVTQVTAQKNKIINSNDKYNNVKPTLDLLTARIIQSETNEFNEHLNFLNVIVDLINLNKHKELYNYADSLKHIYSKKQDQDVEQEPFKNPPDDTQEGPTAKQAKFNHIEEEIEQQNAVKSNQGQELKQEHVAKFSQEDNEQLPKLQLEPELKEEQSHTLLKEKLVLSYSPVIKPHGRQRGKESLVAYKKKDNINDKVQINKKRTYKQTSPDLKGYNVKRNKKLELIRDVYDKITWLTDFHIYLFFELLHKQFPNTNGLCGPVQIHLYTRSLANLIFVFNANNNHWVTISNLDSNNIWKVYDSLSYPKESVIKFFKGILPDEEKVLVSFESVQQ